MNCPHCSKEDIGLGHACAGMMGDPFNEDRVIGDEAMALEWAQRFRKRGAIRNGSEYDALARLLERLACKARP